MENQVGIWFIGMTAHVVVLDSLYNHDKGKATGPQYDIGSF